MSMLRRWRAEAAAAHRAARVASAREDETGRRLTDLAASLRRTWEPDR